MKTIGTVLMASSLAVLSGCVVAPVDPGYFPGPQVYVAPPSVAYRAPAYYGPPVRFGIYGRGRGYYGHRR